MSTSYSIMGGSESAGSCSQLELDVVSMTDSVRDDATTNYYHMV